MIMRAWLRSIALFSLICFAGCGEPMYENAGSPHSLLEDREACAIEMENSPAATAYRQNPAAHPEYVSQVFNDMNRCIERKGWKQARSPYEQEQVRDAIASEALRGTVPASTADAKATDAFVRGVEERLARGANSTR